MECKEKREVIKENHPRDDSNFISHFFFWWQLPILVKGWRNKISSDDFNTSVKSHDSKKLADKLEKLWEEETHFSKKPSLTRVLTKQFGLEFLFYGLLYFPFDVAITLLQPLYLAKMLDYYTPQQANVTKTQAYWYGSVLVLLCFLRTFIQNLFFLELSSFGIKIHVACCSLIYRKCLKLRSNSLQKVSSGQIVNLMSNDVKRFISASICLHFIWIAPINCVVGVYYFSVVFSTNVLAGVGLIIVYILVQVYASKKIATCRTQVAVKTDHRIRLISSLINGIQTIKMFTWEKPLQKLVEHARRLELDKITTSNLFRVTSNSLKIYIHKFCLFLCILVGILSGFQFTSQYVFALIAFYDTIKVSIIQLFPAAVIMLAEAKISIARMQNFLLTDHQQKTGTHYQRNVKHEFSAVELKTISVKWSPSIHEEVLRDVSFTADIGELVGVVGSAGSGKSTLLQVILKEIEPTSGSVDVEMDISYAPQEPWIFSASIKQNILFGEKFVESRYLKVLRVCALERDISFFPFGDNTLVGERGVKLSGGQKARIGLARAVYRNVEIYLLDDPLSAVDAHVADHIFNKCILKFLCNKCVVLVTHQVHFLRNATKIYFLTNGRVEQGDSSELFEGLEKKLEANSNETALEESQTSNYNSQLEVKEDEGGGINSYKSYGLAGGKWMTCLVFVLFILVQFLSNIIDGLVTLWVNFRQDSFKLCPHVYRFFTNENYLSMYAILLIVFVFACHSTVWAFVKYCKRASENLHNNLLGKVVEGSLTFFNNHSSGRIINRFSKDMGMIDEFIPMTLIGVITEILSTIGAGVVVIIVNYWMVIPTLALCCTFYVYYKIFQYTIRKIRRVEGIRRSPIFTHLTASMQGLSVVRASKAQEILQEEFDDHQNRHSSSYYLYNALYFAFAFWSQLTCCIYTVVLIYSLLYFENVTVGGNVGLMITQTMVLTTLFQYGMKLLGDLDAQMVSTERVVEYTDVTPEPDEATVTPAPTWPNPGKITFDNVSMRYSLDQEWVLKDVSVEIHPGEKVGIVGRTGAGKSSVISAFFRLFDFDGTVRIDGIDTKSVPLSTLRSKISIIPQDPVLFLGTLRKNLDPFDEFSDRDLWNALEDVGLKKLITSLESGLDSSVSEGGSNFSVGEKQLLCLVRTILKNNKIVVLDEATANVDLKTDEMIQFTIRKKFKDSTVLTIAHRLNTVMDSDKVLVMNLGCVVEFGRTTELLQNPDGYFYRYVASSVNTDT